ncbi:MAG: hypothetical protein JSS82_10675 [Bacteroidetes bacterium]|nr:hypothetical protein [Bacteroidota bacterium]
MAIDFKEAIFHRHLEPMAGAVAGGGQAGSIFSSAEVDGIEIRMLQPLIRDNNTLKVWPFPGKAKLYCLTMVISDIANQLVGMMDLNNFAGIGDNEYLPINKTIFYWQGSDSDQKSPNQVHIISSIIKSKERLREAGAILANVKTDSGYKSLMGDLSSIAADAASFTTVTDIAMQLASIVGQYLGKVDDNPLGTVVNSFTRLHGDWDKIGVTPVRMPTRNVDFDFELIVRDYKRPQTEVQMALASDRSPDMTPM